jgi:hypothetical protein
MDATKFVCCVARWKERKDGSLECWERRFTFQADAGLNETSVAVMEIANASAAKKWKTTAKSGWGIREVRMSAPR